MSEDFIVRGDHLAVLNATVVAQSAGTTSPRALIWGVDLSADTTPRSAAKHLRQSGRDALKVAAAHPDLAHVFVLYSHGGALGEGSCLHSAAQAATRVHAGLERARGRYVDVFAIDVTGWEDTDTLQRRIRDAVTARAGAAGDVALGWHEIVDESIHAAAMKQLC